MYTKLSHQQAHGSLHERARRTILLLIASQLGLTIAIAAVLSAVASHEMGYSALAGGLIGVLPNYYFASRLLRRRTCAMTLGSLREIYVGEFVKIAFTVALFVIAIRLLSVDFLVVVLTYLAIVMVHWFAFLVADLGEQQRVRQSLAGQAQLHSD